MQSTEARPRIASARQTWRSASFSATEGLALTWNGRLYAFRHDDLFTDLNGPSAMTLLATGVTDFAYRNETYQQGLFTVIDTAVYFTIGNTLQVDSPPATVQRRRKGNLGSWTAATTLFSTSIATSVSVS